MTKAEVYMSKSLLNSRDISTYISWTFDNYNIKIVSIGITFNTFSEVLRYLINCQLLSEEEAVHLRLSI